MKNIKRLYLCLKERRFPSKVQHIWHKLRRLIYPGLILIRINPAGGLCNHHCIMCAGSKKKKDISFWEKTLLPVGSYINLIKNMPKSVRKFEIAGEGEPLLYKDIDKIFRMVKERNVYGSLITNGSLMNQEISKSLIDISWEKIRVSLHASRRDIFQKIHGVDNFDMVIKNIENLLKSRDHNKPPYISLLFVIQKDNYFDIVNFFDLANSLGVDFVQFDTLIANEASRNLLLSSSERDEAESLLRVANGKAGIPNNIEHAINLLGTDMYNLGKYSRANYLMDKWCPLVQFSLEVQTDGIVFPCCFAKGSGIKKYNIATDNIKKIWQSYAYFRKDLKKGKFYPFCISRCNYQLPARK